MSEYYYNHLVMCFLFLCSISMEKYGNCNFWLDLAKSKEGHVFFYHATATAMFKSSELKGWKGHEGKMHKLLNNDLIKICKEYPLSLFCYQTSFLQAHGCCDLANLRPRVIRCVAEHLIRYDVYCSILKSYVL